jgi:L-lactate utilization protein LutC
LVRALDRATQQPEIRRLCASPDVLVGSVHAITEHGQVLIASAAGNQLAAAAFGASQVIWVAGAQKIVGSLEDGLRRLREYCQPLEDVRTRTVYGQPSALNKILIVNGELPGRITIVLVRQSLGF